ncbi:hypothetical protein [Neobacillus sp. PS3-40]|uniref:hypothetical protein n=1 Tax=Neobacillus sp. PS3-40 TaxID=3070679 RepID=UPI0027DF3705|nr:hypothetical protein [Neobacillus sp. PS3-40]WML43201.1 hypothetical protein RCG20_15535 [Neobacillus sp. PS3-40]
MKKNLVAGILAVGLIVAGGTGVYVAYAKDNTVNPIHMMKSTNMKEMMNSHHMQEMMKSSDMKEMMKSTDMEEMMKSTDMKEMQKLMQSKNFSFDQMLPLMKKIHPNLSNEQIKALYEKMHGKDGSPSCGDVLKGQTEKNSTSENKL